MNAFLEHRRRQETRHRGRVRNQGDPMASLISVEVNLIDACNRTCSFCPHADPKKYPNEYGWKMTLDTSVILASQLRDIGYRGRISMSGYGEPMLNKEVAAHIKIYQHCLPNNTIEMNTNSDPLKVETIQRVFAAGLTHMYINLYDSHRQVPPIIEMFREAGIQDYIVRPHWDPKNDFGLILNNRSGTMAKRSRTWGHRCHYPFYKIFIDWNGQVLFCANDWGRNVIVGNIRERKIEEIWMSRQMKEIRLRLADGDRSMHPCSGCNVDGTLHGEFSFEHLMRYYNEQP